LHSIRSAEISGLFQNRLSSRRLIFFGSHFSTAQMPKHDDSKDAENACKKEVAAYERLSKIKGAAQT
jgi:hypothetical protein